MTLQLEVSDLALAREFYTALLGSAPEFEPHEDDPWGNALGFYQDLAPSGQQPVVGGSVHDQELFVTE
jgi:hypothetical protein